MAVRARRHVQRTVRQGRRTRASDEGALRGLATGCRVRTVRSVPERRRSRQAGSARIMGFALGIGHIRTKTHDYVRHGTLTLFAALNYLEGKLITRLAARHRHQEWLAFLKTIDDQTPADLDIHIIADNYATHKHPAVTRWLDRHPRFHMHYTPTSSSWMNLVERFFRDLTDFITEKSFASTRELADAIIAFLAARNENPRRYVWKAKGENILRKINAARRALAALQPASNAVSETAH